MNDLRFGTHPEDFKKYTTEGVRSRFLISEVLVKDDVTCFYSMHDRFVTMGVVPVSKSLMLPVFEDYTKSTYFLEGVN